MLLPPMSVTSAPSPPLSSSLPSSSFVDELSALLSHSALDDADLSAQLSPQSDAASSERHLVVTASQLIARLCALRDEAGAASEPLALAASTAALSFPPVLPATVPLSAAVRLCASEQSVAVLQDEVQVARSTARVAAARVSQLSAHCTELRSQLQQRSVQSQSPPQPQPPSQPQLQAHAQLRPQAQPSATPLSPVQSPSSRAADSAASVLPPLLSPPSRSPSLSLTAALTDSTSAAVLSELQQRSAEIQHLLQVSRAPLAAPLHT